MSSCWHDHAKGTGYCRGMLDGGEWVERKNWREALEAGRLCAVAVTAFAEGITCRMEEDGGLFFLASRRGILPEEHRVKGPYAWLIGTFFLIVAVFSVYCTVTGNL